MTTKYAERIVAFVDILGFTQLIERVAADETADALIAELETVLATDVAGIWTENAEFTIRMFSDCICFSAPPTAFGFLTAILNLAAAQKALLQRGILLRGAITVGRHYESASLIFSEALVRAYHLESQVAIHPRIIVDPRLIPRFVEAIPDGKVLDVFMNLILMRDSDNQVFLNYHNLLNDSAKNITREANLERERDIICQSRKLYESNFAIMAKMAWLERYHNYLCLLMAPSRRDLLVGSPEDHGFEMVVPRNQAEQP